MNVIALTTDEQASLATAKAAVTAAQQALDSANASYTTAYNTILAAHNVSTGPVEPILSPDTKYLVLGCKPAQ